MTDKLDILLSELSAPDQGRLTGLETRVWQCIENARTASGPFAYFSAMPLWLKSLPIATTLLIGGTIGASAAAISNDLDAFSSTPSYSISKIMVPCCG